MLMRDPHAPLRVSRFEPGAVLRGEGGEGGVLPQPASPVGPSQGRAQAACPEGGAAGPVGVAGVGEVLAGEGPAHEDQQQQQPLDCSPLPAAPASPNSPSPAKPQEPAAARPLTLGRLAVSIGAPSEACRPLAALDRCWEEVGLCWLRCCAAVLAVRLHVCCAGLLLGGGGATCVNVDEA